MSYTERARALRPYIVKASASLTDADALKAMELYRRWEPDLVIKAGDRLVFPVNGTDRLFRVNEGQAHTTQEGWEPDKTPALFVTVSLDEWPEFVQPTGAHDAYKKGDKITFEGKHYISLIDANVYSPTAYPAGWQEQT